MKEYIVPIYDDSPNHDEIFVGYIRENAVEIVRCKECKYLEPTTINGKPFYPVCHVWDCLAVDDDGYCYRGERRESA